MAKIPTPLNDKQIQNLKVTNNTSTFSDGLGLQLLLKSNGTKLWEFRYTSPTHKKRRKTSFGTYPNISLKNARDKRTDYLNLINNGFDPIDYYKSKKEINKEDEKKKFHTIEKLVNKYFDLQQNNKGFKEVTIKKAKSRLVNHFYKYLPKKEKTLIHDIKYSEIITILELLENSNKLETLFRVKLLIVNVYKYAYTENIIKETDIFGKLELKSFKVQSKEKIKNNPTLTNKDDIKKLYKSILIYENNLITKYLMLMTIHTAQRQGSLITAKWKDIDFNKKLWVIPKENMKGTASSTKDHNVPLSDIIINYLKMLQELTGGGEYLFPNSQINKTRNKYPHISNNTVTKALRLMGYTSEQQTAHGFRAMFKTVCKENQEEHNLNNEFVERVLAHKVDGDVESAYNRATNIDDMRKVVNWWSNWLEN